MTQEQTMNQEIREELNRIEGMISDSGEGRWWKMLNIIMSIAMACLTVVIIPFGVWTVQQIQELQVEQKAIQEWKSLGPRFTPSDGDKLRLQTKDEIRSEIKVDLQAIVTKLDRYSELSTVKMDRFSSEISSLKDALYEHMAAQNRQ